MGCLVSRRPVHHSVEMDQQRDGRHKRATLASDSQLDQNQQINNNNNKLQPSQICECNEPQYNDDRSATSRQQLDSNRSTVNNGGDEINQFSSTSSQVRPSELKFTQASTLLVAGPMRSDDNKLAAQKLTSNQNNGKRDKKMAHIAIGSCNSGQHRARKVQKMQNCQAMANYENSTQESFLSMFVHGRRHSAVRIDAAREFAPPVIQASEQSLTSQRVVDVSNKRTKFNQSDVHKNTNMESSKESLENETNRDQLKGETDKWLLEVQQTNQSDQIVDKETILFTSVQQLCYEILNRTLLLNDTRSSQSNGIPAAYPRQDQELMCLFVFGRPGSSRGELSYDLVQHSSLIDILMDEKKLEHLVQMVENSERAECAICCPLYHYIDISALIVANIDDRIREYNRLVAKTMQTRRNQLSLVATKRESEELDGDSGDLREGSETKLERQESVESGADKEIVDLRTRKSSLELNPMIETSIATKSEATKPDLINKGAIKDRDKKTLRTSEDQSSFGVVTLSTKERSILQLKLMKYSTCITTKWITILIKQEINRLERRFKDLRLLKESSLCLKNFHWPKRIYLINLIPNQLTLFKSCLYLEQDLSLGDFHRPFWAIKFERRTNIRLLTKESRIHKQEQQQKEQQQQQQRQRQQQDDSVGGKGFQLRLSQIKSSILANSLSSTSRSSSHESLVKDLHPNGSKDDHQRLNHVTTTSSDILINAVTEKLGPKYNESFAQQFRAINRLVQVRYNPVGPEYSTNYIECHGPLRRVFCSKLVQDNAIIRSPVPSRSLSSLSYLSPMDEYSRCSVSIEDLNHSETTGQISGRSSSVSDHSQSQYSKSPRCSSGIETQGPKWAIELELIDSTNANDSNQLARENSDPGNKSEATNLCLYTYQPPRATSRSPLMFASNIVANEHYKLLHSISNSKSNPKVGQYCLIPSLIAYANGSTQMILEVKRIHRRVFKYKSGSDLNKLKRLIVRSSQQLSDDLNSWLRTAILDEANNRFQLLGEQQDLHSAANAHLRSQADLIEMTKQRHLISPSIITYSIQVDISLYKGELELASRARDDRSIPRLTIDGQCPNQTAIACQSGNGNKLQYVDRPSSALDPLRPSLKMRPTSSLSHGETKVDGHLREHNANPKRHVKFCIDQAIHIERDLVPLPVQRRIWISDSLFASCAEPRLIETMGSFADLVKDFIKDC